MTWVVELGKFLICLLPYRISFLSLHLAQIFHPPLYYPTITICLLLCLLHAPVLALKQCWCSLWTMVPVHNKQNKTPLQSWNSRGCTTCNGGESCCTRGSAHYQSMAGQLGGSILLWHWPTNASSTFFELTWTSVTLRGSSSQMDLTQLVTGQRHAGSEAGEESAARPAHDDSPGTLSGKEGYSDQEDESLVKKKPMVILPDPVTPIPLPQWRLTAAQKQGAEKVKAAAKIAEKQRQRCWKQLSMRQMSRQMTTKGDGKAREEGSKGGEGKGGGKGKESS